jgi:CRP/FNR family transcriptional regulator
MQIAGVRDGLQKLYPVLVSLAPSQFDKFFAGAQVLEVPAGTVMFDEHQACNGFPMLLEGAIKVAKVAHSGREIVLYRVLPGESCILTSSCLLGNSPCKARGVAETRLRLVVLPGAQFGRLLEHHPPFRSDIFQLFGERMTDLMQLVEAVAFQKLDQRMAAHLLGKGKTLHTTHQALADELGSVREIVTRLLRSFEDHGWIELSREQIEIRDATALRRVAASD